MHIMGLAERFAQIKSAEAEIKRAELEDLRKIQAEKDKIQQESIRRAENSRLEAEQQQKAKNTESIKRLTPLLGVVGARKILEEVNSIPGWQGGKIDSEPRLAGNALRLAITYDYSAVEQHTRMSGMDGSSPDHLGSTVHPMKAVLEIMVGSLHNDQTIVVGTSYESVGKLSSSSYLDRVIANKFDPVPLNNTDQGDKILEEKVLQILLSNIHTPNILTSLGQREISEDPFLSPRIPKTPSSLPWYRRILG